MEFHEIEVVIDQAGSVQIKVHGVPGTDCLKTTADLERLLGEVETRDMTSGAWDGTSQATIDLRQS